MSKVDNVVEFGDKNKCISFQVDNDIQAAQVEFLLSKVAEHEDLLVMQLDVYLGSDSVEPRFYEKKQAREKSVGNVRVADILSFEAKGK